MTNDEARSIAELCLMAAFADGAKAEPERARLKEVFEQLGVSPGADVYRNVILRRITLDQAAQRLATPEVRLLAYEMAVCICDADGGVTDAEREFLARLRSAVNMPAPDAERVQAQADRIADAPLASPEPPGAAAPPPADAAAIDQSILRYAILGGGLELLPQSLATMAIVPLQMKMVYDIGRRYGHELDRGHIREFLAVLGIGATAQVVEGFMRKLLGGLLGSLAGRTLGRLGGTATGAAMTFATTYALGQVARSYYASGRQLSATDLRTAFTDAVEKARGLYDRYAGEVQNAARSVNVSNLLDNLRGP